MKTSQCCESFPYDKAQWCLLLPFGRYRVGETFVHLPLSRAQKRLERDLDNVDKEMSKVNDNIEECDKEMKELKLVLYAKFGSAINLEE